MKNGPERVRAMTARSRGKTLLIDLNLMSSLFCDLHGNAEEVSFVINYTPNLLDISFESTEKIFQIMDKINYAYHQSLRV